jgi:ATP-dependent protease HslVU (ClpYQ) peptidase subunit
MTTIVWDGKTLAADGRATAGNRIADERVSKIRVLPGAVVRGSPVICYALAGAADMYDIVGTWIQEGCPVTEDLEDKEFATIIITEDNAYVYGSESNDIYPVGDCTETLGSGSEYALSALALKMNAVKAVKHAAKIDMFSGGIGTYINCRTKKMVLKEFEV